MLEMTPFLRETWAAHAILKEILVYTRDEPAISGDVMFAHLRKKLANKVKFGTDAQEIPVFQTATWLVKTERAQDLGIDVMKVFRDAVLKDDQPYFPGRAVDTQTVARVMKAATRAPSEYVHGQKIGGEGIKTDRILKGINVDQMALMYHVMRLGARATAAAQLFKHEMPGSALSQAYGFVRYYNHVAKARGWDWDDERKELLQIRAVLPHEASSKLRKARKSNVLYRG